MFIRRYYRTNTDYVKTYSDEYFVTLLEKFGERAVDFDTADYELVFETEEEKESYVLNSYVRVLNDVGWYLDNLSKVPVFSKSNKVYDGVIKCFDLNGNLIGNKNEVDK